MTRALALTILAGCNRAPVDYTDVGPAPGAIAGWGVPSEAACAQRPDDPSDVVVGPFTLCSQHNAIVPIDDPVLAPCDRDLLPGDAPVFYVFDGIRARAYLIAALDGRELVHDEWGQVPVLVDW